MQYPSLFFLFSLCSLFFSVPFCSFSLIFSIVFQLTFPHLFVLSFFHPPLNSFQFSFRFSLNFACFSLFPSLLFAVYLYSEYWKDFVWLSAGCRGVLLHLRYRPVDISLDTWTSVGTFKPRYRIYSILFHWFQNVWNQGIEISIWNWIQLKKSHSKMIQ